MKVTGCICCMMGLVTMIASTTDNVGFDDKIDQQFFDSLPIEDSPKDKRPFCNAFTGCGKKRSFYSDNSLESNDESSKRIQIPVPIYQALLRAAGQEIRDSIVDRETSGDNTISNLAIDYPAYLARKMHSRERYQS